MVAVVSGSGLGLGTSSLSSLGTVGGVGTSAGGSNGERIYVNAATGNLVLQSHDEVLAALGLDLAVVRTYNSQGQLNDDNGDNWRLGVHRRLFGLTGTVNTLNSTVIKVFGDGAEATYRHDGTIYVGSDGEGAHDTLSFNVSTQQWTWTDGSSRATETYDVNGRLLSSSDTDGNVITYGYTGALLTQVTDASGQVTYLDYTGNNLTQIRVVSQSVTQTLTRYTYDGQNRLSTVTVDLSPSDNSVTDNAFYRTTYTYDGTSTRVASIAQSRGTSAAHASVSFTYELLNGQHRLKTFTDGESRVTTFTYTQASTSGTPTTVPANPAALSTTQQQPVNTSYNLNTGALTTPAGGGGWASAATLETSGTLAMSPRVAFDANGNGVAVWVQNSQIMSRTYTKASNTWSAATPLDGVLGAVAFAADSAGNVILGWWISDTAGTSIYARQYTSSTATWAATTTVVTYSTGGGNESGIPVDVSGAPIDADTGAGTSSIGVTPLTDVPTVWDVQVAIAGGVPAVSWIAGTVFNGLNVAVRQLGAWVPQEIVGQMFYSVTEQSLAIDALGNVSVAYIQDNNLYAQRFNGTVWSNIGLESSATAAGLPRLALDSNGNGLVVWQQGTDLFARRYVRSTNTWAAAVTLDSASNSIFAPALAMDGAGNAIVAWVQSNGTANSLYANRFNGTTATWSTATLLESTANAVANSAGSVAAAISGNQIGVAWIQSDGTRNNVYAARYDGTSWSAATTVESNNNAPTAPAIAIDSQGFVTVAWQQSDGTAESIYQARYGSGGGGPPYYLVPSGATWQSVANTLYGVNSAAAGTALQTALGNPPLTTGAQLTGLPATLVVTTTQTVTVPAYYVVPAGATWTSITQAIYGTSVAAAVTALQTALGNPPLPGAGTNLTVPLSLTYSTSLTRYLQTDVSDPLGRVTTFANDASGRLVGVLSPTVNGVRLETRYTYDANTADLLTVTEDPLGLNRVTTHTYDANGNVLTSRDSLGNTITRTYNGANQLVTETRYVVPDPDGGGSGQPGTPLTTRYAYDSDQHLRFVISADGRVTEHQYNAAGQRLATLQYADAVYDVSGLAAATALTEAQLTTWTGARNLLLLQRIDYTYDFRGNVATATAYASTNSSGVGQAAGSSITRFVYDQRGRLLQTIDPRGEATAGDPNDYRTTFTYDGLGRVLATTEWIDASTTRTTTSSYQDENNRIVINHANGLVTTSNFNRAGDLQTVQNVGPGAVVLGTTTYAYDANGRLRMVTDPTGQRAYQLYDEAGRRIAQVDSDGTLTELIYNRASQLIKTIQYADRLSTTAMATLVSGGNPANVTLTSLRDSLASVPGRNPAQDRITRAIYDNAGRQVYAVDELGAVTQNLYDGAGRVVESVKYLTPVVIARTTDEVLPGALTVTSVPASDRRSRNFYDNSGNLLATLDAVGYLVEYFYDGAGRLTRQLAYANATPTSFRLTGTLAQLRPATDDETATDPERDAATYFFYDNQGRRNGSLDAEGYLTETVYDTAGRVAQQIRYDSVRSYTAGATVASLRPTAVLMHRTDFTYDGAGRVVQETSVQGVSSPNLASVTTLRSYDLADNVVSVTAASGSAEARTMQARYDALGRVVAELSAEGTAQIVGGMTQAQIDAIWNQYGARHGYDLAGRRVSSTVSPSGSANLVTYFYYDADGRQTHVVNPEGEVTEVRYDARGRLIESISYDAAIATGALTGGIATPAFTGLLNAAAAANGRTTTTYTYLANGHEVTTTTAEGAVTKRRFNAFGEEFQKLERINASTEREHTYAYDQRGQLTLTRWDPSGIDRTAANVYDAFGRLTSSTDQYGNQSRFEYDRLGRAIATVDPLSGRRTTTYDAFSRVLTTRDAFQTAQNTTTYGYDDFNRSVLITTPEGIGVTTTFNRHGQRLTVLAGGNTTTYVYDLNGRLASASDSMGSLESRTYDRAGRQLTTTDARGIVTSFTYDGASRKLTRTVDSGAGGLARLTTYVYDNHGRVTDVTEPDGVLTRTTYDRDGRLTLIAVDPNGVNLRTQYVYDNIGNAITVTEGHGGDKTRVTQYTFDKLGRRTQEAVDPAGLNLVTQYRFDRNGNVTRRIDAAGNSTWYVYDAADRLRFTIDSLGGLTETAYDVENRLLATRRYATAVTPLPTVDRVTIGSFTVPSATGSRLTQHVYDRNGRERYTINALGGVTENTYDASGNVTRVRLYANAVSAGTYTTITAAEAALTSAGNSTATVSANDRVRWTTYDLRSRATFMIDALGGVVRHEYDGVGKVVRTTAFATPGTAGPSTDATMQGWATANAANAQNRVTRTWYDGAGRTAFVLDAEGYLKEITYQDSLRRSTETVFAAKPTVPANATTAHLRARSNGVTITANAASDQATTTELDAGGRIAKLTDALGNFETYGYDAVGNRVSLVNKKGSQWQYVYDNNGRMTHEIAPSVAVTTVTLEANGSLSTPVSPTSYHVVTRMQYDLLGNVRFRTEGILRSTPTGADITTQQRVTEYVYDVLGRQVRTNFPSFGVYSAPAGDELRLGTAVVREETTPPLYSEVAYDILGNAYRNRDVAGNYGFKAYDLLGRVTHEVDADGYATAHAYDVFGNETVVTRHANRLTSALPTGSASIATSDVTSRISASAGTDRTITSQYDRLNRATSVARPTVHNFLPNAVTAGGVTFTAGATTLYEYDAFGQVQLQRELVNPGPPATYADSYFYYNRRGERTAEVDALGYLSLYEYDETGDVTRQVEYSRALAAGWNKNSYGTAVITTPSGSPGNTAGYDREVRLVYDRLNRKTTETRYNVEYTTVSGTATATAIGNPSTTFGYDAVGNQTRTTDHNGAATYTYYDVLGRVRAIAEPSRDRGNATTLIPLVAMGRDAHGNLVEEIRYANGASAASETSFTAGAAVGGPGGDRKTLMRIDSHGHVIHTQDASGAQRHASYNARGEVAKEWQLAVDADGVTDALVTIRQYDKLGQQTAVIEPQRLGGTNVLVTTQSDYNAFGEIWRRGVDGGWQEYFDYDQAGRVWRTNSGDGVSRVYLYDLAGNATGEIRSQQRDLKTYVSNAAAAHALPAAEQMRTETRFDLRGSVVEQRLPSFGVSNGLEAIGVAFSIGQVAGPSNPNAIYQRVAFPLGIFQYHVNPTATLAQSGGWYRNANGTYSQDGSHNIQTATRITWAAPNVAGVNAKFEYRVAGSGSIYTEIPVAQLANNTLGANVSGLLNTSGTLFEYRVTYSRAPENLVFAEATGTFRVDGTSNTSLGISQPAPDPNAEIAPIATTHTNNTFSWAAPTDTGITAILRLKLASQSSFVDLAVGRVGPNFQISGALFSVAGTYDFEIVHYKAGSVIAKRAGQISSNGSGITRTISNASHTHVPIVTAVDPVPTVSGTASSVAATITSVQSFGQYETGDPLEPQFMHYWTGQNTVALSWPSVGSGTSVKVKIFYRTSEWGWPIENRTWETSAYAPGVAATGANVTWAFYEEQIGSLPAGGLSNVTRVQVMTGSGSNWTVVYDQSNPPAAIGRSVTWVNPTYAGAVQPEFAYRTGGGSWIPLNVVISGGNSTVDVNALNGSYEYRVRFRQGGRLTAEQIGTMSVSASAVTLTATSNQTFPLVQITPVSLNGERLSWSYPPEPGTIISGDYVVYGVTSATMNIQGSSPSYYVDFTAAPPGTHFIYYNVYYNRPGETKAYAQVHGHVNLTVTHTPYTATATVISQAPVYPSGLQQISAPTHDGGDLLGWTTPAEAGASVSFRYWAAGGAPISLPWTPNGSGYRVNLGSLAPAAYSYEILYTRSGQTNPYARAAGTFNLSRTVNVSSTTLTDTTSVTQTPVTLAPRVTQLIDRWGNAIAVTDATGQTSNYRYNQSNQLTESLLPQVNVTSTTGTIASQATRPMSTNYFDLLGRLVATRDANGNLNKVTLNAAGQIIVETHADTGQRRFSHDAFGNQIEITNELGFRTRNVYNGTNLLTQVSREVVTNGFGTAGPNDIVVDAYGYDAAGRRITETNGENETTRYFYDLHGNLRRRRTPMGRNTDYEYNAHGKKTREVNPLTHQMTWSYDYFGRSLTHTDMGGYTTTWTYDPESKLLLTQNSTSGQRLTFAYDEAGHLKTLTDLANASEAAAAGLAATNRVSSYVYDIAGRRTREKTFVDSRMHQDQRTEYDAAGRIAKLTDLRYSLTYTYDAQGNRTRTVSTYFDHEQIQRTQDLWYRYDAMNRVTVSQGVNASNVVTINSSQGVNLSYDVAGRRTSAQTHGQRIASVFTEVFIPGEPGAGSWTMQYDTGSYTDQYFYDGLNRLTRVDHIGVERYVPVEGPVTEQAMLFVIARHGYDKASRETSDETYTVESRLVERRRTSVYNDDGSITNQTTQKRHTNNVLQNESIVTYNTDVASVLRGYTVQVYATGASPSLRYTSTYTNNYRNGSSYMETGQSVSSSGSGAPLNGSTTRSYNANGELVSFVDTRDTSRNRYFANGASGQPLTVVQGNYATSAAQNTAFQNALARKDNSVKAQHFFFANGQNVGSFGQLTDGGGTFKANFDVNYQPVSDSYPAAVPPEVVVQGGDTLRAIAARVFGDASLWYILAEENGLSNPDELLVEGTLLRVPNEVIALGNSATSFKPFDMSQALGDTTPTQPAPPPPKKKGCGVIGMIIMVVIAIVVTVITAGAAAAAMGAVASGGGGLFATGIAAMTGGLSVGGALGAVGTGLVAGAIGGAAGSIASQGFAIATGMQEKFDWKGVATSAIASGVTAGLGGLGAASLGARAASGLKLAKIGSDAARYGAMMINGAISSALTQGIAVATGLQKSFSWRDVAISAVSAPIANEVGAKIAKWGVPGLIGRTVSGATGALVRKAMGGKVDVANAIIDAFGNAIGNSINEAGASRSRAAAVAAAEQESGGAAAVAEDELDYVQTDARRLPEPGAAGGVDEVAAANGGARASPDEQRRAESAAQRAEQLEELDVHDFGKYLEEEIDSVGGVGGTSRYEAELKLGDKYWTMEIDADGKTRWVRTKDALTYDPFADRDLAHQDPKDVSPSEQRAVELAKERTAPKFAAEADWEWKLWEGTAAKGRTDWDLYGDGELIRLSSSYEVSSKAVFNKEGFTLDGTATTATQMQWARRSFEITDFGTIDFSGRSAIEATASGGLNLSKSGASVEANVAAEAVALQVRAEFQSVTKDWLGGLILTDVSGEGALNALAIGGSLGAKAAYEDGKFQFRAKASASVLVGGKLDVTANIDVRPLIQFTSNVATQTYQNAVRAVQIATQIGRSLYDWAN